jgi:hypothetical protein
MSGSGYHRQITHTGATFLTYLDCNSTVRPSLTGLHFGPASLPELRVLQSLQSMYTRMAECRLRNLHGVLDAAEIIHDRQLTGRVPAIPEAWSRWIGKYIAAGNAAPMPTSHIHYAPHAYASRLQLALDGIQQRLRPFCDIAHVYGRVSYYDAMARYRADRAQVFPQVAMAHRRRSTGLGGTASTPSEPIACCRGAEQGLGAAVPPHAPHACVYGSVERVCLCRYRLGNDTCGDDVDGLQGRTQLFTPMQLAHGLNTAKR